VTEVITLLCPTRGRPELLAKSVTSVYSAAAHPEAVEFLVALDPDDTASYSALPAGVKAHVTAERWGYRHLHAYYNALAERATGTWLMLWNDDAFMQTEGWDEIVRSQQPGVVWGISCDPNAMPGNPSEFPAFPKAWAEHLGHVCLSTHVDMWVNELGRLTGTGRHTEIRISHPRTYDQTYYDQDPNGDFHLPAMAAAREEDARKLLLYMQAANPVTVSVIFPSRGRPAKLRESVLSLRDTASAPDAVEVLVALDHDDPTSAAAETILTALAARTWYAPERYGYAKLHKYLNELAVRTYGNWLMLWNDDATMLTQGWDSIVRNEKPGVLWPSSDYAPSINTFPVWPAGWTRALGHVSLNQSADMWMYELGVRTASQRRVPISIHHEHFSGDATARERDAVANVSTFHAPAMVRARERDAEVLRRLPA
jgi:hypothetical protein